MEQAQEKKKKPAVAVKPKATATANAGAEVAQEKQDIGAMLRPDKAAGEQAVKVGAATDKAEKDADKVADAVAAPVVEQKAEKENEEAEPVGHFYNVIRGPPVRAGPEMMIRRVVADQNGNQPNTDELATVPAIDGQLAEVGVAASEEAEFDEMSGNDFSVLGAGESSIMMKAAPSQTWHRPDYLPSRLTRLLQNPGTGSHLPGGMRTRMEERLCLDLSRVRVHRDQNARVLTAHVQARAFVYGCDIFLANAGDINDLRLMAHESAHCIQQGAARPLQNHPARGPPAEIKVAQQRAPPAALRRFNADGDDGWLERRAEGIADKFDFYGLLKVMIGRRLFTGKSVKQDAMSYVGAFMKFIGADETFEQMKKSGSLENGFRKIREGSEKYNLNWPRVRNLFSRAYDEFEWTSPISSLKRIFKPFFSDLLKFGKLILKVIAELVAEAFVIAFGPRGKEVWDKIKAIGEVIGLVIANPLGFAMNLIRAAALGIKNFALNILSHIKKGLLKWLLGPLAANGVTLPDKLDLKGIINVLLQVLGLTYPQLRPRIVRKLNPRGELKVTLVEKLIKIINILRTEGIAGIWRKLLEYIDNLQMEIIAGVRNWVVTAVITAGIRKLVAWSNPAGALLDILFTIYKLIVFFVEKFEQIVSFASSIFESIGKIARGKINEAAAYVENTLSLTIPIMISFLTSLLGLPDIAGTVRNIIGNLRAKVHKAVDKVLDFVIKKVKKLIAKLIGKFKSKEGEPEQGVNMQGTQHKLAFEQEGRKRRLYMHSEKTEMAGEIVQKNNETMRKNCAEPITTKTLPEMEATEKVLRDHEKVEDRLSRKPESNASSPDNNKKRADAEQKVKTHLETGTDPNIRATEAVSSGDEDVDQQPEQAILQEGEQVAEDQKKDVEHDAEEIEFRFVIVPEESDIEASWGKTSAMQTKRETFKKWMEKTAKQQGKYGVELDHNPEYQILWRLGHLEYDNAQRVAGDETTPEGRMFPKVAEFYQSLPISNGDKRDRKSGDNDFVMAVRYDAHRGLPNTQTKLKDLFEKVTRHDKGQQAFVPKDTDTAIGAYGDLAAQVPGAAEGHQTALVKAYQNIANDSYVSDETVADISRSGPKMIQAVAQAIQGQTPEESSGEAAAGHVSGIGMRSDPVDAELLTGDYGKLGAAVKSAIKKEGKDIDHSRVFEKHHLLEQAILKNVKERFTETALFPAVTGQGGTVAGLNAPGAPLGETSAAALATAQQNNPKLSSANIDTEQASLLSGDGFTPATAFSSKGIKANGYSIAVLRVVNQLLSSQSESNVDAAVSAHLAPALATRASTMRGTITRGYKGMSVGEDATPEQAQEELGKTTETIRSRLMVQVNDRFTADLKDALPKVLDDLTAHAHGAFTKQFEASLGDIYPDGQQFVPGSEAARVFAGLKGRYEKLKGGLSVMQTENHRWVA